MSLCFAGNNAWLVVGFAGRFVNTLLTATCGVMYMGQGSSWILTLTDNTACAGNGTRPRSSERACHTTGTAGNAKAEGLLHRCSYESWSSMPMRCLIVTGTETSAAIAA
eukprot:1437428-Rhodomonas_salina.1